MTPQQSQMALAQNNMAVLSNITELTRQTAQRMLGRELPATIQGQPVDSAYLADLIIAKVHQKLNPSKGA